MSKYVTIELDDQTYEVLSKWASVSRTINEAIRLLGDLLHESDGVDADTIQFNINELITLRYPLDNVNAALKTVRMLEQIVQGKRK